MAVSLAVAGYATACATDAGLDESKGKGGSGGTAADAGLEGGGGWPSGGSGNTAGGGTGGGGWPGGGFGSSCNEDADCDTGMCRNIGGTTENLVCVTECQEGASCPSGGYCAFSPVDGYLCIPENGNQCAKCQQTSECPNIGDVCKASPLFDRFCARDCSFDGQCPGGFVCVSPDGYPSGSGGAAGSGGVAGDGGASQSKPPRICVPENDGSCPCDAKRDGVSRKCSSESNGLVCEGTESCNGSSGSWEGCTAGTPQPELCDGVDNDCNGTPDDGDPATMCAGQGNPAHATWACSGGACEIGGCEDGWAYYPPSLPASAGCTCQLDAKEQAGNETCADAKDAGSVTDANPTALNISGRLHSDTDVDWHSFATTDSNEGTTNSYHIRIQFTAPVPTNDEFVFDVIRGDTCGEPDASHSGLTEYDWCVDGDGGASLGEQSCGPTAAKNCGPHSKPYLIRVRRRAGATGTCQEYTLTVTAKGNFNCDFSATCDPQTNEL